MTAVYQQHFRGFSSRYRRIRCKNRARLAGNDAVRLTILNVAVRPGTGRIRKRVGHILCVVRRIIRTGTQYKHHLGHLGTGYRLVRLERTVLKALDNVLLGQGVDYLAVHLDAALVGECCTGKSCCCAGCRHAQRDQSLSECHIKFLLLLHGRRSASIGEI